MRGATSSIRRRRPAGSISIHAPLAGCDKEQTKRSMRLTISIHAPLAGCDRAQRRKGYAANNFNPRTPCGVRHEPGTDACRADGISIHAPLAGCDLCRRFNASCIGYFNPRTPCGVRHEPGTDACRADGISIHAPLAGCDLDNQRANGQAKISIHAPLAGCDIRLRTGSRLAANFNPRTPCGVRQEHKPPNTFAAQFQSTHPLRGATHSVRAVSHHALISIHAPLAGCDLCRRFNASCIGYFNPRTPCGVRLARPAAMTGCAGFQSTHPLRGATSSSTRMRGTGTFQSTHPLRGATIPPSETVVRMAISIHAPLAGCDAARAPTSFRSSHFNPRTPCGVRRKHHFKHIPPP